MIEYYVLRETTEVRYYYMKRNASKIEHIFDFACVSDAFISAIFISAIE